VRLHDVSRPKCSCDKFERLEGASVNAYASAFLDEVGRTEPDEKNRFRCRVCGTLWEKRAPEAETKSARPSLVKLSGRKAEGNSQ
jgi:hypothetical protein